VDESTQRDLVIRGATIVDGSGPRRPLDASTLRDGGGRPGARGDSRRDLGNVFDSTRRRDAVAAGARGLSTSYLDVDENLKPVPSRYADLREKIALAQTIREAGGAVLEAVPNAGSVEEMKVCIRELGEISRASGLLCTLQPIVLIPTLPDLWKRSLDWISEEVARGAQLYGQSPPGPMNFNLRLDETFFPFFLLPTWGDIMRHPVPERAALLADLSRREALTQESRH